MPSAVCADPDGPLVVGRDAVHSARLGPAPLEPDPKRCIDDGAVVLGHREVPAADLIAAVPRRSPRSSAAPADRPPRGDADRPAMRQGRG